MSDMKTISVEETKGSGELRLAGLSLKWYFIALGITLIASYFDVMASGWLGAYTFATLVGVLMNEIGDRTPIVKDYFGGGSIVTIFGGAALVYFNVLPEGTVSNLTAFVKDMDYLGWVVGGLICGSILGMDRKLLISAGSRYFVPIIAGIIVSFGLTGVVGMLTGYGFVPAIMFVALPIMGGGTAAGAVPMSEIFGSATGQEPGYFLSMLMPAVALGNAMAIVGAGLLDKLGKKKPELTGNGELMKGFETEKEVKKAISINQLGVGFLLTGIFYSIGKLLAMVIPVHYYATTILAVAFVKIANILPDEITEASNQWYNFISKLTIPAVLFTIGLVHTDLATVLQALDFRFVLLCLATVVGAIIGAGGAGKLVNFYFVESAMTAGLCMANMGGSGDVATLGAGKRMNLMPFAQVSSRLGGALIILIGSVLSSMLKAYLM